MIITHYHENSMSYVFSRSRVSIDGQQAAARKRLAWWLLPRTKGVQLAIAGYMETQWSEA